MAKKKVAWDECPHCNGDGIEPGSVGLPVVACKACGGTGKRKTTNGTTTANNKLVVSEECSRCGGTGIEVGGFGSCKACSGRGYRMTKKKTSERREIAKKKSAKNTTPNPDRSEKQSPSEIPEVVRAGRFEVVDKHGKVQAVLGTDSDGAPLVGLRDKNGREAVWLTILDDGMCVLAMNDRNEVTRARLALLADGTPLLSLAGENNTARIWLGVDDESNAYLGVGDAEEKRRTLIHTTASGHGAMEFDDAKGRMRAQMGITKGGDPYFGLYDVDGEPIIQVP